MNLAHLTSAHPRYDTRIFHKMCVSLAHHDHEVNLIVADGNGDQVMSGINILDVGSSRNRLDRIRNVPGRVLKKAKQLDADLYHLHDPELIPIGLELKRLGKRVIFDSHEDVPQQILSKPYLNPLLRWALSKVFCVYQNWACKQLDGIVTATPFIRDKFLAFNPNTIDINNFPLLEELGSELDWSKKESVVCYVGGISRIRGAVELIQAMGDLKTRTHLILVGNSDEALTSHLRKMPGWHDTESVGHLSRSGVREVMARSVAGVVNFLPAPNHIDAQPNKMFEYMSAGIPVIASDFPLWREIISGNDCGLLVDPLNPSSIAEAIDYLVTYPYDAERMGRNGRVAVLRRYNWPNEEKKLLDFYKQVVLNSL